MILIIFFLLVAILLESGIVSLPLTLIVLLFGAVMIRKNEVFVLAFLSGALLDIVSFKTIGASSLYFTFVVFLIFLYQRKFEIGNLYFIIGSSFFGSLIYLIITGVSFSLLQSIFITIVTGAAFLVFKTLNSKILYF